MANDLKSSIIDYKLIFALILELICVPSDLQLSIINSKLIFTLILVRVHILNDLIIYEKCYGQTLKHTLLNTLSTIGRHHCFF
jgi:hypothetical protein